MESVARLYFRFLVRYLTPIAAYLLLSAPAFAQTATLTSPANGATLTNGSVEFTWSAATGAQLYTLWVGTAAGQHDVLNLSGTTSTSYGRVSMPVGTLYTTLWTKGATGIWSSSTSTFAVSGAALTSPANGATLHSSWVNFSWPAASGAQLYTLRVGTTAGGSDLLNLSGTTNTSYGPIVVPAGKTVYATLWTEFAGGNWTSAASMFTVAAASLTSPSGGSTVGTGATTFTWTSINGASEYELWIGTSQGASDVLNSQGKSTTSYYTASLPAGTLYARLWTYAAGGWAYTDSTFTTSTNGGGGGGSGFWLPYTVTPQGSGTNIGIGVVPSSLSSSTLTSVTASAANEVAFVPSITVTGGKFSNFSPYALVYSQVGGDGNWHLYSVNLSNASNAPTPTQISNLSFASGGNPIDSSCVWQGFTKATDPTSAFLIVMLPTASTCNSGGAGNSLYLVHLSDSASTTPVSVPSSINTLNIESLFNSDSTESLAGISLVNSSGTLAFVPAANITNGTFTPSTTQAGSFTYAGHRVIHTDRTGAVLAGGSVQFIQVAHGSTQYIYRVTTSGTLALVYSTTGTIDSNSLSGSTPSDNANIYFYDAVGGVIKVQSMAIATGALTTLATVTPTAGDSYTLVDSDGSQLIVKVINLITPICELVTFSLTSSPPVVPTTLTSSSTVFDYRAFLDWGSDHLFVNSIFLSTPSSSAVYVPSSSTPIPGVGGANTAFSELLNAGISGAKLTGSATTLLFKNLTDTTMSGASVYTMTTASPYTQTQIQQGGSNYVVPTGDDLYPGPVSPSIATGIVVTIGTGASNGIAIDVAGAKMITISQAGDNISPL